MKREDNLEFWFFQYWETSTSTRTRRLNSQACAAKIKLKYIYTKNRPKAKPRLRVKIKDNVNVKNGVIVGRGIYGLFTVCFNLRIKHILECAVQNSNVMCCCWLFKIVLRFSCCAALQIQSIYIFEAWVTVAADSIGDLP